MSTSTTSVTVIIPTLNSDKILNKCLDSIISQQYINGVVNILVIDGGSTDKTREIASKYGVTIIHNPLRTGEAAKALGIRHSTGDIIAFIDSDNILTHESWLTRMLEPFNDPRVVASEPMRYAYRSHDGYLTRYCALMGLNDPLCYYIGNYDRWNEKDKRWTRLFLPQASYLTYTLVVLSKLRPIPTIGANGTLIRRHHAERALSDSDHYFDIDIFHTLSEFSDIIIAKVHTDIVHIYANSLCDIWRKQNRRISDYYHHKYLNLRKYPWKMYPSRLVAKFIAETILVLPMVNMSLKGFCGTRDYAWFAHIPVCIITLVVYGWGFIKYDVLGVTTSVNRREWRQVS